MDLDGQVVIITGASTGIGANTAVYLTRFKAKLALVARSVDKLENVRKLCLEKGAKEEDVLTIAASVRDEDDIKKIIQTTVDTFGRIDHLINNAAIVAHEDVQHSTFASFDAVMATNLRAPMFLSKEAMPHLKKTKGSVVNISSLNSEITEYRVAAYCMSKAALEHLTRLLALEVAEDKVRVNCIAPGFVVTDTMLHSYPDEKKDEMEKMFTNVAISRQPLGGGMRMDDVAKAIHFLLTDAACAITGETIRVDNGYHISLTRGMGGSGHLDNTGLTDLPTQQKQALKKSVI